MKQVADLHKSDRNFEISGDYVYIELHPYRQVSVTFWSNAKLSPKYFRPFKLSECIGVVAYKQDSYHFPCFLAQETCGNLITTTNLPYQLGKESKSILNRMTIRKKELLVTKVLLKWKRYLPEMSHGNTTMIRRSFQTSMFEGKDAIYYESSHCY